MVGPLSHHLRQSLNSVDSLLRSNNRLNQQGSSSCRKTASTTDDLGGYPKKAGKICSIYLYDHYAVHDPDKR